MSKLAQVEALLTAHPEWIADCLKWRGEVLVGKEAHWCYDWDGLPIDETCSEWPCGCADEAPDQ